ncbi:MAG: SAM-dependent methyltransferase [Planctomycetaceae bacterium]|nr:SAM-dependent methyltransferase [Planctomycetaceae bacterium]
MTLFNDPIKKQIIKEIRGCGYGAGLIKEDYCYFNGKDNVPVDVVGFYQSNYNSSTACIAAIERTKLHSTQFEEELQPYRWLGSPVLLVYDDNEIQFWKNSGIKITLQDKIKPQKINVLFSKYKKEFSPESIYRAKIGSRVKKDYQLSFADIGGLMGIIEEKEGLYLSELAVRVIKSLKTSCKGVKEDEKYGRWLFQSAFWLIGAKILKDKQVERFKSLKISDVEDLIERVQRHYNASETLDVSKPIQRKAFAKAALEIVEPVSSFSHLTTESLAYVYENALVSKETRKLFGTHATPSWLVNYIIWEMIDWIEEIPQEDRFVLEPACGHAPFLTAATRLLGFLYKGSDGNRHAYLKNHLQGIERDGFAEEIARLSLTLADIPNSNGWKIENSDIYADEVLKRVAQKATILFCNPPFENFKPEENKIYGSETGNKAAEVLAKTLQYMQDGSVFGVILPQGLLHRKNIAKLRKLILDEFELRVICNLPDNVFAKAGRNSTVLLGRKVKSTKGITYLNIIKSELESFKNTYQSNNKTIVSKRELYQSKYYNFRTLSLKEIWEYCSSFPKLNKYITIDRGIEYKAGIGIEKKRKFIKTSGFERGFYSYDDNDLIERTPKQIWLNVSDKYINNQSYKNLTKPKILLNYIRRSRSPWRLSPWIDSKGYYCTNAFLSLTQKDKMSWYYLWAILNSPMANAYIDDHCANQHNDESAINEIPIPPEGQDLSKLESLVRNYFEFDNAEFKLKDEEEHRLAKKQCLLEIDAEILRLYDLPPRLEKKLLDYFEDVERKGVDFDFDRYYEKGLGSYIPLHIYISDEFKNSTVEKVMKWVEKNRTPEVIEALKKAEEDFEDD